MTSDDYGTIFGKCSDFLDENPCASGTSGVERQLPVSITPVHFGQRSWRLSLLH